MKQYYIGQPIVHLNRFWRVIRIGSDRIEIKSCNSNDRGFHRITTLDREPKPQRLDFNSLDYKGLTNLDLEVLLYLA